MNLPEWEWREWTRGRHSAPVTAGQALGALGHLGIRPEAHPTSEPQQWRASCPVCGTANSLMIADRENHGDVLAYDENGNPPRIFVTVGCKTRCCEPSLLVAILNLDADVLRLLRERERWRGRSARWEELAVWMCRQARTLLRVH